ncbi:MAG: quinolinate synthase NadA [Clostridia bacterium]|nr:quinolinate synthase NadA [Clostridia bacterium]
MTTRQLQDEIVRLKREKGVCILAHAYMDPDITEVADYVGDSFGLSQKAAEAKEQTVLMCGVRFMAETCKMLCPDKKVILSSPGAGCPMAAGLDREELEALKEGYPGYTVVAYINTTADLKRAVDVCVTSSSAVKIVRRIENDKILFVPDQNLGAYLKEQIPEKEIALYPGGCPTHYRITAKEIEAAKKAHPKAKLLMHPECSPKIQKYADYLGSTTGIMDYALNHDDEEYLIATENSIVKHLQLKCPEKRFFAASKDCVCHNMKLTTLTDVYHCVLGDGGEVIELDDETLREARRCIDEMLRFG